MKGAFKDEDLMNELCGHLHQIGINATLLEPGSPESIGPRWKRGPFSSGWVLGCIEVKERNLDLIQVERKIGGGDTIGGMEDEVGGHEPGQVEYTYHYIVRPGVPRRQKQVEAEIQLVKKGFIRREVVDFRWKGSDLAQRLNADIDLRTMLLQNGLPQLPIIEIYPDTQHHCTRITLQPQGQQWVGNIPTIGRALPTREAFDIFDRIALHIRNITTS